MKVDYKKRYGKNGTVYTQSIHIDNDLFNKLIDAIRAEIDLNLPRKSEYVFTSGYETFLRLLAIDNRRCHLNLTQLRFIKLFKLFRSNERIKNNRNTLLFIN